MLPLSAIGPLDPLYTFVCASTGHNTHISVRHLRAYVRHTRPEIQRTPVDAKLGLRFLSDNTVSHERIAQLVAKYAAGESCEPIIFCADGNLSPAGHPDCFLADGHHRYAMFALAEIATIPCVILAPDQWHPYRIHAPFLDCGEDTLRAVPPLHHILNRNL